MWKVYFDYFRDGIIDQRCKNMRENSKPKFGLGSIRPVIFPMTSYIHTSRGSRHKYAVIKGNKFTTFTSVSYIILTALLGFSSSSNSNIFIALNGILCLMVVFTERCFAHLTLAIYVWSLLVTIWVMSIFNFIFVK